MTRFLILISIITSKVNYLPYYRAPFHPCTTPCNVLIIQYAHIVQFLSKQPFLTSLPMSIFFSGIPSTVIARDNMGLLFSSYLPYYFSIWCPFTKSNTANTRRRCPSKAMDEIYTEFIMALSLKPSHLSLIFLLGYPKKHFWHCGGCPFQLSQSR